MNVPLVSILIPAHNAQKWVAETIRSAVSQTWKRKEIIVVDDGSRDNTGGIAARSGATVLRHAKNQGKGASLMDGMHIALAQQATCVVTLDGDGQHRPE